MKSSQQMAPHTTDSGLTPQPYAQNNQSLTLIAQRFTPLQCLLIILVLQTVAWTLFSALTRPTLPFDSSESIAWGMQWQWGYDKHPPLAAWLSQLFYFAGNYQAWTQYFLSALSVDICLVGVYLLTREFLSERAAVCSALALQTIYYYNIAATQFNPNVLMLPLWSLTAYYFYRAVTQQTLSTWLATGALAALALLAKYESILLLMTLIIPLCSQTGRQSFKTPAFYAGIVVFGLLLAPHIRWLFQHQFLPFAYTVDRTTALHHPLAATVHAPLFLPALPTRITFPLHFLLEQLGATAVLIVGLTYLFYRVPKEKNIVPVFAKRYVFALVFGPLLITLLISALYNLWLHSLWGFPYFTWLGVGIIMWLNPVIDDQRWRQFLIGIISIIVLIIGGRAVDLHFAPLWFHKTNAAHFPGNNLANAITKRWHENYHQALNIVGGAHVLVSNITTYSPDHPKPFYQLNPLHSPWINQAELRQNGAVIVWDANSHATTLPPEIQHQFPEAVLNSFMAFTQMTAAHVPPVWIGVAFLPPHNHTILASHNTTDWSQDQ